MIVPEANYDECQDHADYVRVRREHVVALVHELAQRRQANIAWVAECEWWSQTGYEESHPDMAKEG